MPQDTFQTPAPGRGAKCQRVPARQDNVESIPEQAECLKTTPVYQAVPQLGLRVVRGTAWFKGWKEGISGVRESEGCSMNLYF